MVQTQLKANNMDGLYSSDQECGCLLGDDFAPCGGVLDYSGPYHDCVAGVNIPSPDSESDFWVSSPDKALENWPKCNGCDGVGAIEDANLTIKNCTPCLGTGHFVRNDKDYLLIQKLLRDSAKQRSK